MEDWFVGEKAEFPEKSGDDVPRETLFRQWKLPYTDGGMSGFFHAMQIVTLAGWLSVAGFGVVGMVWREEGGRRLDLELGESRMFDHDFKVGEVGAVGAGANGALESGFEQAPPERLPEVPDLPELTVREPLPKVPDLPKPRAGKTPSAARKATESGASRNRPQPGRDAPRNASGAGGGSRAGAGGGMSAAQRMANGRMPAPRYPTEARRRGQEGTVVVEFTVDANGRVISARASEPSRWPLLNHEAVRTVRRWRFPKGGVMTLRRPIVFRLR